MSAKLQILILRLALFEKHYFNIGCNLSQYSVMQSCAAQDVTKKYVHKWLAVWLNATGITANPYLTIAT
jgi:hypothetical protein